MERDFVENEFDFRLATKPRGFQPGKRLHVVKRDIHFSQKKRKKDIYSVLSRKWASLY